MRGISPGAGKVAAGPGVGAGVGLVVVAVGPGADAGVGLVGGDAWRGTGRGEDASHGVSTVIQFCLLV